GQVHPFAEVRMAEKAHVPLVAITLDDAHLDVAADAADRANGAGADAGAHQPGAAADVTRAFQVAECLDDRLALDDHWPAPRIGPHERIDLSVLVDEETIFRPDHRDLFGPMVLRPLFRGQFKTGERLVAQSDEAPRVIDHAAAALPSRQALDAALQP